MAVAVDSNAKVCSKRERTCIACGNKGQKTGLVRIVRSSDGSVSYDPTGRANGRGAYVCSLACFEKARMGRLARALKTTVDEQTYDRIREQLNAHAGLQE